LKKSYYVVLVMLIVSIVNAASFKLNAIFSDHMVIQRNKPVIVYGTGNSGSSISASFGTEKNSSIVNKEGDWEIKFSALPASSKPIEIIVSNGTESVTVKDVLVGDIWLCAGQSNMDRHLSSFKNTNKDIAEAGNSEIRLLNLPKRASLAPVTNINAVWQICSPDSVKSFSATGYYFGRTIYNNLKIPIGLIENAVGGSDIETWIPLNLQLDDPVVAEVRKKYDKASKKYDADAEKARVAKINKEWRSKFEKWKKNGKKGRQPRRAFLKDDPRLHQNYPGNLYNSMAYPLIRFPIKGVIWYQGESNVGRADNYFKSLNLLTSTYRAMWKNSDMPFYYVQLPNFRAPWKDPVEKRSGWALVRDAILKAAVTIPNTGMAITIDLGEAKNIHPQNKRDVGARLAKVALRKTYGEKEHVWTGPLPDSYKFQDSKVVITFENGGSPLAVKSDGKLFGFALEDVSGKLVHADAVIDGNNVVVTSSEIKAPVAVYYAWANNPAGSNLVNKKGLPASPFCFKKSK